MPQPSRDAEKRDASKDAEKCDASKDAEICVAEIISKYDKRTSEWFS